MNNVIDHFPEAEGDEALYLKKLFSELSDDDIVRFSNVYRTRRKDPQTIMILNLLGLVGIAGVHRFVLGQIGMGLLYFFTAGLCLIGVIVDLLNYRELSFQYNRSVAQEIRKVL